MLAAAAALVASLWFTASAHAQYYGPPGWTSPEPNYYASLPGEEGLSQAMYPCPRPTPPLVGQTYITYPPFAPQQFMYVHWTGYGTLCGSGLCCGRACGGACGGDPCGDQCGDQCGDPCCRGLCRGGLCCRGAGTSVSVTYGHHYHLWPHPSLRNQAVGLRTPASVNCGL
jgi:hypothetical protein